MKKKTNKQSLSGSDNILVAFFSHSGNTRSVAKKIKDIVSGDLFEIKRVKEYPVSYHALLKEAKSEIQKGKRPAIIDELKNIQKYNVVFIGYPNWWNTFPEPVLTFLSKYDLSGKTIIPFCTHGGSGMGKSVNDINKICPNSTVHEGIDITGYNTVLDETYIVRLFETH